MRNTINVEECFNVAQFELENGFYFCGVNSFKLN